MSFLVIRLQKQAATAAGVCEIQNAVPLCNKQFGKSLLNPVAAVERRGAVKFDSVFGVRVASRESVYNDTLKDSLLITSTKLRASCASAFPSNRCARCTCSRSSFGNV